MQHGARYTEIGIRGVDLLLRDLQAPGTIRDSRVILLGDQLHIERERRLIVAEVDRYAPPDPAEPEIARAFDAVRARVGAAEFAEVLRQTGGSPEQVQHFVRDDLRIAAYLQQRFGTIQPSERDVAQYYRDHPDRFGGRSLQEVHDDVAAQLTADRRSTLVADWVAGLRRRANINILPR